MADWNIRPRAIACTLCGKPFAAGDKGHSLLSLAGEEWIREDYCPTCFLQRKGNLISAQTNAWTFVVPTNQKTKATEEVVKRETAEHLLRTLLQRNQPNDVGMIYILAILLERKKQFVERRTTIDEEGHRIRMYEQRSTGDIFSILDPCLRPADVPALQMRIVALLEGKESLDQDVMTSETEIEKDPSLYDSVGNEEGISISERVDDRRLEDENVASKSLPCDMSMEVMHEELLPFEQIDEKRV